MAFDFGPAARNFQPLGDLGKTFGNAFDQSQKRVEDAQKRQALASLGQLDLSTPEGQQAAQRVALSLGDLGSAAKIMELSGTLRRQQGEDQAYRNFSGGGQPQPQGGGTVPLGSVDADTGMPKSLIRSESGGSFTAQNDAVGAGGKVGHFGRAQFGQARLQDAMNAGAIPQGTTAQAFMASPGLQQQAERWHFSDIENFIAQNGLDKAVGTSINGTPVTVDGMKAVAHLGGKGGLMKFMQSGGRYDPPDANGTTLSAYLRQHAGTGGDPSITRPQAQVANTEADTQRLEREMVANPGTGQPSQMAQMPAPAPRNGALQRNPDGSQTNTFIEGGKTWRQDKPQGGEWSQPAASENVQVAQNGGTQSDMPAQGATPSQGFAIPGQASDRGLPPNDGAPQHSTQALQRMLMMPNVPANMKDGIKGILDRRFKYADENSPLKTENTRLQNRKLEQELNEPGLTRFQGSDGNDYSFNPRTGATTKIVDGQRKGPEGFQTLPDGSMKPIAGGPSDPNYIKSKEAAVAAGKGDNTKALPAELGARVAIGQQFLEDYPNLRKMAESGKVTGLVDGTIANLGRGEQGETLRRIKVGSEAIVRNLTGAGMNEGEARQRVQQYEPTRTDDAATVVRKLDMMNEMVQRIEAEAYRGRGVPEARKGKNPYFEPSKTNETPAAVVAPAQGIKPTADLMKGARKAADGKMYAPDPDRPGKYLQLVN